MRRVETEFKAAALSCRHLAPIDLVLRGGQCLAIAGPSGSGKSLILRMIADLIPHEGECWLNGVPASSMTAAHWRGQVRYVAAEPAWWSPTVRDHFQRPGQVPAGLKRLLLDAELMALPPERLSTGERQRMAFLRSLEDNPSVVLLDEPTSALDNQSTEAVEVMIKELLGQGRVVIFTSHDEGQIARLAEQVLRLEARV